jgi:hypothetical protein
MVAAPLIGVFCRRRARLQAAVTTRPTPRWEDWTVGFGFSFAK